MKKLSLVFLVLVLSFSFVACVSTQAVRLGDQSDTPKRPIVPWKEIQVYQSADKVKGKYEEIALLSAKGDSIWTTEKGMWNSLKKKASKMGANAIILDATSEPGATAEVVTALLFGVGGSRKGKALAIYIFPEKKN